jgi:hypothetical protein
VLLLVEELFLKNRWSIRHYLIILVFFILLAGLGILFQRVVHAQTGTVVAISPAVTDLYFNGTNTAPVQVIVTDVELLNAFDITITYDAAVAAVTDWSEGDFLSNLACVKKVNDPGFFRLACTQLATPGQTGSGPLIDLTFEGLAVGSTPLTFSAVTLSNSSSQSIPVDLQDATLNAGYLSSQVFGVVFTQGQANRGGIPIVLGVGPTYGQGPFSVLTSPDYGINLVVSGVPNGDTYLVTTEMPGALNIDPTLAKTVSITGGDVLFPALGLLSGNAVWTDNAITDTDLDAIRDSFDLTGSGMDADVNQDGRVNIQDLALAGGNFGLTSADVYAGWLP